MQRDLALWAGNDLEEHAQVAAQRHLAVCPECRGHWQRLQAGQRVLEQVRSAPMERDEASVWIGVRRQLRVLEDDRRTANWRGWLPVGALAAACLTVLIITAPGGDSPMSSRGNSPIVMPMDVNYQPFQVPSHDGDRWNDEGPLGISPDWNPNPPRLRFRPERRLVDPTEESRTL